MSDLPRRRSNCRLVVDLEGEGREVLGEYRTTEEDSVSYWTERDGTLAWAPEDCVAIVAGYRRRPGWPAYEVEPEPLEPKCERCGRPLAGGLPSPCPVCVANGTPAPSGAFACSPDESAGQREAERAAADLILGAGGRREAGQ